MTSTSGMLARGKIVDRLRNEVISGRIEPGAFLRQEKLVARFGVSRMPVREALIQLTNEGLLESIPNVGVKVRPQPPEYIQEFLTPLRRTVEVYALQLCFDSLNKNDFRLWDSILKKLRKACERSDYSSSTEHEFAFHRSIIQRAGDPTLLHIWSSIACQVAAYMREWHEKYAEPLDIYREHAEIVETFRTGDKEASVKLYSAMIGAEDIMRKKTKKSSTTAERPVKRKR